MSTGRPTLFKPEYAEQARKLCLLGYIDEELASFFEVSAATIQNWKNDFPEFLESVKKGKELADANVADRLYKRAMGYEHPEVHISNYQGVITETPITKIYPPDATSTIFWLKNRQRNKWRDKVETGITDKEGNDAAQMDPQDIAKRIAFILHAAAAGEKI